VREAQSVPTILVGLRPPAAELETYRAAAVLGRPELRRIHKR
jgi:hypothetical protein